MSKTRNAQVDIFRAVAMLLVILGHTMTGSTSESQNSLVFRAVWSLQMPLFFLISGYVLRFHEPVHSSEQLKKQLIHRTVSLMQPFFVWSILIRGILFRQEHFLDLRWMAFHMDAGYWFLFSLWMISILFLCAEFCSEMYGKGRKNGTALCLCILICVELVLLYGLGILCGFTFLAIKQTAYYYLFYLIGVLYGRYGEAFLRVIPRKTINGVVLLCLAGWLVFLCLNDSFHASDGAKEIAVRLISSLAGCASLLWIGTSLLTSVNTESQVWTAVRWIGTHTLELYLIHYLLLRMIMLPETPTFSSPAGIGITILNFVITLSASCISVYCLEKVVILRKILFSR